MKFILNADDFGRTDEVNDAIVYGFDNGYLSRTTIMVNMPYFEKAVDLSKSHNFFDKVGLHLNLTSGYPLTDDIKNCKSFVGESGRFNSRIFKSMRLKFFLTPKEKKSAIKEIDAQIEKFLSTGFNLLHADSHGHIHTFMSLKTIVLKELKKYGFNSVRISKNLNVNNIFKKIYKFLINIQLIKFNNAKKNEIFFGSFINVNKNYNQLINKKGNTEIMLHPYEFNGEFVIGERMRYNDIMSFLYRGN